MALSIQWNGHACFSIDFDGYTIVFDPYEDNYVPGLAPLQLAGHEVFCSHQHGDHNAAKLVTLLPARPCPFQVTKLPCWHDDAQGSLRGENTIHLLEGKDFRIAHFGDLGEPLSATQLDMLQNLDIAMIPVGGYYTIGPAEAAALVAALKPRIVLPMHYRGAGFGFDVLATVEDFLAQTGGGVFYLENQRVVAKDSPAEISVLRYHAALD